MTAWFNPGSIGIVVSGTFLDLMQTILEGSSGMWALCPPALIKSFNKQTMTLTFVNSSKIYYRAAISSSRIRGLNAHWSWCDEIAGWDQSSADIAYRILRLAVRLSQPETGLKPFILITSSPKMNSLFNHWKAKFDQGDPHINIVRASSYDNPYIAAEFSRTLGELDPSSLFARAEVFGEICDLKDSAIFPMQKFKIWHNTAKSQDGLVHNVYPEFKYLTLSLDTAFSEKAIVGVDSHSFSAAIVSGIFVENGVNKMMVIDAWQVKAGLPDLIELIIEAYEKFYAKSTEHGIGKRIDLVMCEAAASGFSVLQMLQRHNIPTLATKTGGVDKISRAIAASVPLFENQIYVLGSTQKRGHHAEFLNEFMNTCQYYPFNPVSIAQSHDNTKSTGRGPDDLIDAFSYAVQHYIETGHLTSNNIVSRWERRKAVDRAPRMNPYSPR